MVLQDFLFLDETSGSTSNSLWIPGSGSQVTVQVTGEGTLNLVAQGQLDAESNNWTNISLINMNGLDLQNSIVAAGIYIVPCDSLKQLRFINSGTPGSVKVYGSLS